MNLGHVVKEIGQEILVLFRRRGHENYIVMNTELKVYHKKKVLVDGNVYVISDTNVSKV